MLKSGLSPYKLKSRGVLLPLCVLIVSVTLLPLASGQTPTFSLTMGNFDPSAVVPGQSSNSIITVSGSGEVVDLGCTVNTQQLAPACTVSPTSVSAPGSATVTVVTTVQAYTATPANYTITVTGTAASGTLTASRSLPVLSVAPQYTITVSSGVAPSSVHAGNGGQATISINPLYGYSQRTVTLACSSITPLVTYPPVCAFTYPPPDTTGAVISSGPASVTLTISTVGPPKAAQSQKRLPYALWLPFPMLALAGLGAAAGGKRSRRACGLLALFVLGGSFLLTPACSSGNSSSTTSNSTTVTPNNTYTFTLSGVDNTGEASSNSTTPPTVTLTVD
jgi:hypothetical protein